MNLQTSTDELFSFIKELYQDDEIIQNPTSISTENLEIQTFLTYQVDSDSMATQHWTFVGNGHEYSLDFFSPITEFNSPENTEILDHFIKSIKIISEGKSTATSPSSFDTAEEDNISSRSNQPSSIDTPISQDTKALMSVDIPELKDNLMDVKESLTNGNTEDALTGVTDIENQLLSLQKKPSFLGDLKTIKDSIVKADLKNALQDISKVQTQVIKCRD